MSLISKEVLLTHLSRAEMAESVTLPIEFFRDLIYQEMSCEKLEAQLNEAMWNYGEAMRELEKLRSEK